MNLELNRAAELRRARRSEAEQPAEEKGKEPLSLRQAVLAKRMAEIKKEEGEKTKGLKGRVEETITAPVRQATNGLLRWAWMSLIPSFGLTLIYINTHVFLRWVFGEKLFCRLGEEWIPKQLSAVAGGGGETASKSIGLVEAMGLLFLDIIFGVILISILSLIALIVSFLGAGLWTQLSWVWSAISSFGLSAIQALIDLFKF